MYVNILSFKNNVFDCDIFLKAISYLTTQMLNNIIVCFGVLK